MFKGQLPSVPVVGLANTPRLHDGYSQKTTVTLDDSNRITLSRELRQAAGISKRQKFLASSTPGRIVLEMKPNTNTSSRIIKRGKLKVWTDAVPSTSIEQAVEEARH